MSVKKQGREGPLAEWKFPLDGRAKNERLSAIRRAVQQKRIQKRPSFMESVWNQFRFQTWQHWVAQGGVLLLAMYLVFWFGNVETGGQSSIAACSVFLVFAGNICLSSVAHLFSWHMAELEKTLYMDLKQMVCIRMLEAGLMDLLVLALLTGFLGCKSENGIFAYLLYLLVPFLWSDAFYLHMLTHFRSTFSGFRELSLSMPCGILALFPAFWEDAYKLEYVPTWGSLSLLGFFVLAMEIYCILGKIDAGDGICQE